VTETELQRQRAQLWRVNGNAIHTPDDARNFIGQVGLALMYPVPTLPVVPSFFAAFAGSTDGLPDAKHAFADPRKKEATDLMVRLLRDRDAYEVNLFPDNSLIVSAQLFPFVYALVGDRNPKALPKTKAQGATVSPLEVKVFEAIQKCGPLTKSQLQELISRDLSNQALDHALNELWSILKIIRVNYQEKEGASWDLLYRWSRQAVMDGSRLSLPEAISALLGKYLEAVVAADRDEVEQFFAHLAPRSKVREALNALLAARELSYISVGPRTLIHLTPAPGEQASSGSRSRPAEGVANSKPTQGRRGRG
jgi:hypothetical protein